MSTVSEIKIKIGGYWYPVTVSKQKGLLFLKFNYNKKLIAEIKVMSGARWHPDSKIWSIHDNFRNWFQLNFLMGKNPYENYDKPLIEFKPKRDNLFAHQVEMAQHILSRNYCIIAGEMGTGKTLAALEAAESLMLEDGDVWYIGPKSGVFAVARELLKWNCTVNPKMLTYEKLVKVLNTWEDGWPAPKFLIFDESPKIKNPTAKRSQCAMAVANAVRAEHKENGYVVLMTGTPAPRTPEDWWHQCLTSDTWVTTSTGPRQIQDLVNIPFYARVDGRNYKSKGFIKTGEKVVYEIQTKEGYNFEATCNHPLEVDFDGFRTFIPVQELKSGYKLVLNIESSFIKEGVGTFEDGYLVGLLIGDGNVYKNGNRLYGRLSFWKDDFSLLQKVIGYFPSDLNICFEEKVKRFNIFHSHLQNLIYQYRLSTDKQINGYIESETSSEFLKGLLSGLFDTDGTVNKDKLRIGFSQTDKNRIKAVQRILLYFGIKSSWYTRKAQQSKIEGRIIYSKDASVLLITSQDAVHFYERIGFQSDRKQNLLQERIKNKHNWPSNNLVTFTGTVNKGKQKVYNCSVNKIKKFAANGIVVHNCEVAMPGFIREGNIFKFKDRLCITEQKESMTGGVYKALVSWLDNELKCKICGELEEHENHIEYFEREEDVPLQDVELIVKAIREGKQVPEPEKRVIKVKNPEYHPYIKSINEVQRLYRRLNGLVLVKFKKDCLDLPEKQYKIINIKPTPSMLRAAKAIVANSRRSVQALNLLRELSDGFQYGKAPSGEVTCPECLGEGRALIWQGEEPNLLEPVDVTKYKYTKSEDVCPKCGGEGKVLKFERTTNEVKSPKDDVLLSYLDEYEDVGRFIVWGGFTGTIERLGDLIRKAGWATLKVDGRGYVGKNPDGSVISSDILLDAMDKSHFKFDELRIQYPKVCFIGQPKAGGMALTLTGSPIEMFYSNDFDGGARMQAEDRFHRPGMDINRGALIVDLICLESDQLVLDNLQLKKDLQNLSMGELSQALDGEKVERNYWST